MDLRCAGGSKQTPHNHNNSISRGVADVLRVMASQVLEMGVPTPGNVHATKSTNLPLFAFGLFGDRLFIPGRCQIP